MPDIKFQHIVSFSSEDKNHPAENLLKAGGSYKWKGATPGEKQLSAVIQLEKAYQIYSLDIGNEGSAFVEVLVGRSSSPDQDFETSTYGLSFITLHAPPDPGERDNTTSKEEGTKTLGAFRLKAEPEDKGSLKVGTLFARRDHEKPAPPSITGAAAIRAASKLAEESLNSSFTPSKPALSSHTQSAQKRKHPDSDGDVTSIASPPPKVPLRKHSTSSGSSSAGKHRCETPPALKKTKSEPVKESPAREFGKVMEGVVFVLSGYTNPRRGEIRDKALKMGAQYRSDWGKGCTHLVCAFAKTPKYNAVAGKGKIVTHHWVNDCYKTKKLLNWKDYRCGDAETPSESSEDEEGIIHKKKVKTPSKSVSSDKTDVYGEDTEPEDSGEDTEDELRKLKEKQASNKKSPKAADQVSADPYGDSTDEDEFNATSKSGSKPSAATGDDSDSGLPELPDFFTDKKFFLYGDFVASERRLLVRYITAFNGDVCDYMSDDTNYVVTNAQWDKNFDEALSDAPSLIFVKPKWVFSCNEKNKLVPYQPYIVVPQ
ncbi:DNA repair protein XRCC1-like isoform X2 [Liolophura sinensis]|uniref:DNA repair protein XRCC1-like isoform X2 n=1 Tax=Liolophura sinensis TaxID=3198878 RepID=UPI003158A7FA